jgi:hypothetical protein
VVEGSAKAHKGEFEQDKPGSPGQKKAAHLASGPAAAGVKIGRHAGKEDKRRRTEVRYPTGEEERRYHDSLRLAAPENVPRKWQERTPAMAAGLTDHRWTLRELVYSRFPGPLGLHPSAENVHPS